MPDISILDVTLRDGGYINNWEFKDNSILKIVNSLINANIDVIECGYIDYKIGRPSNSTIFNSIESLNSLLSNISCKTNLVAMINTGACRIESLPTKKDTCLSGIRLAFHKEDVERALKDTELLINKGYHTYVQPMITSRYSDDEMLNLVQRVNKMDTYGFYLVDSFGSFSKTDFNRLLHLVDDNLNMAIKLGFHSHNNLQLAFSNAIEMINSIKTRDIIIDSSIHGMGRGAGNLNTELLADYLNKSVKKSYKITSLLEIIDQYIENLHRKHFWGYSTAHFLSASTNCHPNYATYYLAKQCLSIVAIEEIINNLDRSKIFIFDEKYAEDAYQNYIKMNESLPNISNELFESKEILVLAPGTSIKENYTKIKAHIRKNNPLCISVNFIPQSYKVDYVFFANQKRYNEFINEIPSEKLIVTSNINLHDKHKNATICDYTECLNKIPNKFYNATLMLLSILSSHNAKNIALAGFDGYTFDKESQYSYDRLDIEYNFEHMQKNNTNISVAMKKLRKENKISFITKSIFD